MSPACSQSKESLDQVDLADLKTLPTRFQFVVCTVTLSQKNGHLCPDAGCPDFDHLSPFTFHQQITKNNQDEHHVPTTLQRPSYPGYAPTGGLQEGKCYYSSIIGARTNDCVRVD